MSNLHQIQIRYDPHHDRAMMRIRSTTEEEFRFWLTRRYVKLLWKALGEMHKWDPDIGAQKNEGARAAMVQFQRESALAQSDFKTEFNEQTTLPLGSEPILLARIQGKRQPNGPPILCMHPRNGKGIELAVGQNMLHSFTQMLMDTASNAEWELKLHFSDVIPQPLPTPDKLN